MNSDEIESLRKSGKSDEDIAALVRENSAIEITADDIAKNYALRKSRGSVVSSFGAALQIGCCFAILARLTLTAPAEPLTRTAGRPARVEEKRTFAGVPVLVSRPAVVDAETQLVVLFHGFGPPESPQALARVLPLQKLDAVLAYVNLPLVADRLPAGGTDEMRRLQKEDFVNGLFFRSISGAAGELGPIVAEVAAAYHLDRARGIGLFGFSAGGSAALLALMESEVPVAAAVIVNAPTSVEQNVENWERVMKMKFGWDNSSREAANRYDVERHADQIAQREMFPALLLVQGDADESFSVERSREVSERLKSGYAARGARDQVQLEVIRNLSHNFGQPSGNASTGVEIDRMAEKWFQRFLATKLPGK